MIIFQIFFINFSFSSFSKKITSRSSPDSNAILISSVSIDHLQNHFLPGSIGITHDMHYYITQSTTHPGHTIVTQIASVDYRFVSLVYLKTNFFGYFQWSINAMV